MIELSKAAQAFYDKIRAAQAETNREVTLDLVLEAWYQETPGGRILRGTFEQSTAEALWFAGLLTTRKPEGSEFYEWIIRFPLPCKPVQMRLFEDVAA